MSRGGAGRWGRRQGKYYAWCFVFENKTARLAVLRFSPFSPTPSHQLTTGRCQTVIVLLYFLHRGRPRSQKCFMHQPLNDRYKGANRGGEHENNETASEITTVSIKTHIRHLANVTRLQINLQRPVPPYPLLSPSSPCMLKVERSR